MSLDVPIAVQAGLQMDVSGLAPGQIFQHARPCSKGQLQICSMLPSVLD